MRVETLERIMEDGSVYELTINLDTISCFNEALVPGMQGKWKGKVTLALTNGMVIVVNKTYPQFKKIMSSERK